MALPATDGFSQTTGSTQALTTYNASWTIIGAGNFEVPSSANRYEPTGGGYNTAYWNADSFSADHYSQVVVTAQQLSQSVYSGPAVCCQAGVDSSYHLDFIGADTYFSGDVAGAHPISININGSVASWAAGDVCKLTAEGSGATRTIKVYKALAASPTSFTLVYTYDDTSGDRLLGGSAGIFAYGAGDGGPTNWEGGNIGGGGGPATPARRLSLLGVGG